MRFLGLDTSNYTTSCALYDTETGTVLQRKKLLPVPEGQAGLRQSDAVFHHTRQLPELIEQLAMAQSAENAGGLSAIDGIGVSVSPRPAEGSYMPCFLCGRGAARILAAAQGIPLYETSHQTGHILAALFSAGCLSFLQDGHAPFLSFHVSGGTTECVLCTPDSEEVLRITRISDSSDLKAGQAIDRVGLMLGLQFPCGPALEALAMQSDSSRAMRVTLRDGCCSLSGLQNQCEAMQRKSVPAAEIARYCLNSVAAAIRAMAEDALRRTGCSEVLFAGGVMSDLLIRNQLASVPAETAFAEPEFSCDNAAGTALFAFLKYK